MYPTIIQNAQCKMECLHKKALNDSSNFLTWQKSRNEHSVDAHFPSLIPRLNQEDIPTMNIPRLLYMRHTENKILKTERCKQFSMI